MGQWDLLFTLLPLRVQYFQQPWHTQRNSFLPQQIEQEIDFWGSQHFQVSSPGEHSG